MATVREEVHIDAPPERVWDILTDPERVAQYNVTIVEVKNPTGRLDQVGASFDAVVKVYGRRIEGRWEVVEVDPQRRIVQRGSGAGGGTATVIGTIEPSNGGTNAAVEIDYELPAGFLGELANRLFVERSVERDVRHTNENLKALAEGETA
jgi:carbon monoxide dehydrogenase subunit G